MTEHGNTPVLVGVGLVSQREDDPRAAREPLALMIDAALAAGADAGATDLLRQVDEISVPKGRWRYRDPGRAIGAAIGVEGATTTLATVGVPQERLIGAACQRIAEGASRVALVVGGEAGHRLLRASQLGVELTDTTQDTTSDVYLRPADVIMTEAEIGSGLGEAAVGYYAIIDSAYRAAHGIPFERHRQTVADLYSGFSRIAAANPEAWRRTVLHPDEISQPSPTNPFLAFPYTKRHATNWSVDQASALLLCSAATADAAGIPRGRWVYPLASVTSEHMVPLSARAEMHRCPGIEVAADWAFAVAGVDRSEVVAADLYTCFPVAVLTHAAAVGLPEGVPLTIIGGMPQAGGPFNNNILHIAGQLARRLREDPGGVGLVTSVSGVLTKHCIGVWGRRPPPNLFTVTDVTDEVAARTQVLPLADDYAGGGTIAGSTVLYTKGSARRAVAIIDTDDGRRTVAWSEDTAVMGTLMTEEVGDRPVTVGDGRFGLVPAAVGSSRG